MNIARDVRVDDDHKECLEIMLDEIEQFSNDIRQYDFNMRSNSFLDSDTKLRDKYLKGDHELSYSKLVQLNAEIRDKSTVLKRLYNTRHELIKSAISTQDIILAKRNKISEKQAI